MTGDIDTVGPAEHFHHALNEGRFLIQRCGACERHVFHPRMYCPHCYANALDWVEPSGRGTVHAVTIVARRKEKGGPYNVALIDLEEGVRLMSRVEGMTPEEVTIGLDVEAGISQEGKHKIVVFRPRQAR